MEQPDPAGGASLASRPQLERLHAELPGMLARTLAAPPARFASDYAALVARVETDFRLEEQLMDSFQCADAHLHRAQHARMLSGLHHAAAALEQGDPAPGRRALGALHDWLPFHIDTMDRHLLRATARA